MKTLSLIGLSLVSLIALTSCGTPRDVVREEVALRVSSPAWMPRRVADAGPFNLMAFERMHERAAPATVYIEGDGQAHVGRAHHIFIATPTNPVGLHLASKDNAINLAALSRPCQYNEEFEKTPDNQSPFCGDHYWTGEEYSQTVLDGYNKTLDIMKRRYGITEFNLVGYDGGATIAAMLAGSRSDVSSLRSVAGRFKMGAIAPYTENLKYIPQHHFIGGADTVVRPDQLHSYLQALGDTPCATYTLIQEAEHEKGWVDKWPGLRAKPVGSCARPPAFVPDERPEPVYAPRDLKSMKK